jgi:hypothetical protein
MVEGELDKREKVRPAIRRESGVTGRHDGDKMVLGGADRPFRRESTMVVGRDVLKSDGDRAKERGEVR